MDFVLKVTGEEVNMIGIALGKLPYENVATIIPKLSKQIQEQQGTMNTSDPVVETVEEEVE